MAIDMSNPAVPNGPIPGENYTSNTKNYPWHRPPDITHLDDGVEFILKQISTKQGVFGILNMLQMGISVVQIATMIVTAGIGGGKWTPDYALLLAGPAAKLIQIMADSAGIKYEMGLEDDPIPTISFLKAQKDINMDDVKIAGEAMTKALPIVEKGGFASPPVPAGPTAGFADPTATPDDGDGSDSEDMPDMMSEGQQ